MWKGGRQQSDFFPCLLRLLRDFFYHPFIFSDPVRSYSSPRRRRGSAPWGFRLNSVVRRVETELGALLPKEFPDDLSREILAKLARELKGVEGVRQAFGTLRARVSVASSSVPG
jgi:hypothetical protein